MTNGTYVDGDDYTYVTPDQTAALLGLSGKHYDLRTFTDKLADAEKRIAELEATALEREQVMEVYRRQAADATGWFNEQRHRADVAEQERDALRKQLEHVWEYADYLHKCWSHGIETRSFDEWYTRNVLRVI